MTYTCIGMDGEKIWKYLEWACGIACRAVVDVWQAADRIGRVIVTMMVLEGIIAITRGRAPFPFNCICP